MSHSVCNTAHGMFVYVYAPTSRSPLSKFFRFSESCGKRNRKMWSQIKKKLILIKGVTSPRKKSFAFWRILPRGQLRTWNVDIGSQKCTGIILLELMSKGLFNKMKIFFVFFCCWIILICQTIQQCLIQIFFFVNFFIVRKYGPQSWIQHNALENKLCLRFNIQVMFVTCCHHF